MKGLLWSVSAIALATQASATPLPPPPFTIDLTMLGPVHLSNATTIPRFSTSFKFLLPLTSGLELFSNASAFSNISAAPAGLTFDPGTSSLDALTKTLILEYGIGSSTLDINITLNESTFGSVLTSAQGVLATAQDNLTGSFKSDGSVDVAEEIRGGSVSTPEPASIALLGGVALLVPIFYRRRRRKRSSV